jgi:hypothetical protein
VQSGGRSNSTKGWFVVVEAADADVLNGAPLRRADEYLQGASECLPRGLDDHQPVPFVRLPHGRLLRIARADGAAIGFSRASSSSRIFRPPFTYFRALQAAGIETIDYKVLPGRRLVLPKLIVGADDAKDRTQGKPLAEEEEEPDVQPRYVTSRQPYTEVTAVFGRTTTNGSAGRARNFQDVPVSAAHGALHTTWAVLGRSGSSFRRRYASISEEHLGLLREELREARFVRDDLPRQQRKPERLACLWDRSEVFSHRPTKRRSTGSHVSPRAAACSSSVSARPT